MAGRWSDEWRDRGYRGGREDWRDEEARRWSGAEDRSWARDERVFGERDSGAGYQRPQGEADDRRAELDRRRDWQDRDYGGVSPAMRRGDYDTGYRPNPRFQSQDYTRGGRYYGDDGRASIYREEYGMGGREYGPVPRGYDEGRRFGTRDADARWRREMSRGGNDYGSYDAGSYGARSFSGGTGGYDYERGYGDAGREYDRGRYSSGGYSGRYGYDRDDDRGGFEDRARDAGDFFRRTGEKVKSWFSDMRDDGQDYGDRSYERGARGLGPKGYKRSDERISEEVHQRLTDDSWLDASNISCSVSGGEVTLSGTVENREAKHRAERIVEDLSGVNHVQNNLRIESGSYFTSAGPGYGDSVQEAQMRRDDPLKEVTDGNTGGSLTGNGSSGDDSAATRSTTRRT